MSWFAAVLLASFFRIPGPRIQEDGGTAKQWKEMIASFSTKKPLRFMIARKNDVLSVDLRYAERLIKALPLLDAKPTPCLCRPGPVDRFVMVLEDQHILVLPNVRNHHWFSAVLIAGDRARRFVLWDPYCLISKVLTSLDSVDGAPFADKINDKMVALIDQGKVMSEIDLLLKLEDVAKEALRDLGYREDAGIAESEKKIFDEELTTYQKGWTKRLQEKQGK